MVAYLEILFRNYLEIRHAATLTFILSHVSGHVARDMSFSSVCSPQTPPDENICLFCYLNSPLRSPASHLFHLSVVCIWAGSVLLENWKRH